MTDLSRDIAPIGCHGTGAPPGDRLWMAEAFIPKLARVERHLADMPPPTMHPDAGDAWPRWLARWLACPHAAAAHAS